VFGNSKRMSGLGIKADLTVVHFGQAKSKLFWKICGVSDEVKFFWRAIIPAKRCPICRACAKKFLLVVGRYIPVKRLFI